MFSRKKEQQANPVYNSGQAEALKNLSKAAQEFVKASSNLSSLGVEMNFVSNKMLQYAQEMSRMSAENEEMIRETEAEMEEVDLTVESASDILKQLHVNTNELVSCNHDSTELLNEVNAYKNQVMEDSRLMEEKIEQLVSLAGEVDKFVESVQSIANQTNLLALNASIEAARAGEHGRGFAVVADEIRGLSDETKQNLVGMRSFLNSIKETANDSKTSIEGSVKSTGSMSEKIDLVKEAMDRNTRMLSSVSKEVADVDDMIVGIKDSTAHMKQAMLQNSDGAHNIILKTESVTTRAEANAGCAKHIEKIDDDLTKISEALFAELEKGGEVISADAVKAILANAKNAHMAWLEKLKAMVSDMKEQPLQLNPSRCAFGHYYLVMDVNNPKIKNEWNQIGTLHAAFHKTGDTVIKAIARQDEQSARDMCAEAEAMSGKLLSAISAVEEKLDELKAAGESI